MGGPYLGGYREVTAYTGEMGGGLSRRTLRRYVERGEIEYVRIGGRYLFTKAAIDAFLARYRVPAKAEPKKTADAAAIRGIVCRVAGGAR